MHGQFSVMPVMVKQETEFYNIDLFPLFFSLPKNGIYWLVVTSWNYSYAQT